MNAWANDQIKIQTLSSLPQKIENDNTGLLTENKVRHWKVNVQYQGLLYLTSEIYCNVPDHTGLFTDIFEVPEQEAPNHTITDSSEIHAHQPGTIVPREKHSEHL